jgi:hypothetical protein
VRSGLRHSALLCPSARPDSSDAVAIGVVEGSGEEPRVRPLEHPMPATAELLQLAEPVRPTEVFRFAAPCLCTGCSHFDNGSCQLAAKVVQMLPTVQDRLPACEIRPRCRWFAQEGAAACLRCPQIVTDDVNRSARIRLAVDPGTPVPIPDATAMARRTEAKPDGRLVAEQP